MSTDSTASILKKSGLSITETRATILSLFKETDGALAHADIEKKAGKQFDRVTIYRTLQTFVDKGIIHTIPTADNSVKYALCKEACTTGHHNHQHIHFICDVCTITYCLHVHNLPNIQLPQGFLPKQQDIILSGICKKCNA